MKRYIFLLISPFAIYYLVDKFLALLSDIICKFKTINKSKKCSCWFCDKKEWCDIYEK